MMTYIIACYIVAFLIYGAFLAYKNKDSGDTLKETLVAQLDEYGPAVFVVLIAPFIILPTILVFLLAYFTLLFVGIFMVKFLNFLTKKKD